MTSESRPDVDAVLGPLKTFQERTARYVFNRLYTDEDYTRRFLVADEVGLGKTLVARGVIAQTIDHLWDDRDRIDIVYLCSNSSIARQNLDRLVLDDDQEHAFTSRITLLPKTTHEFDQHHVNYISFTPGTSLDLKSSMGRMEERVLLYHLLKDPWNFTGKPPQNVLQGYASADRFRTRVDNFDATIDDTLAEQFIDALDDKPHLEREFNTLCDHYTQHNSRVPDDIADKRREVLGEIREVLASVCVDALSPDLIVLDEFQRFRDVLDGDTDEGDLARELFAYSDENAESRVLLLSATPYKMYTMAHESSEDHLADFVRTLEFLTTDANAAEIRDLLDDYRRALYQVHRSDTSDLHDLKHRIETQLSSVMARTERLAASPDRNGMLREAAYSDIDLRSDEVHTYLELRSVAEHLDAPRVMNYWKSAPYLLNFMNNYALKEQFRDAATADDTTDLATTLTDTQHLTLDGTRIEQYDPIDYRNPTLRAVIDDYVDSGAWRLLWLPPSLPYYEPDGPYADPDVDDATKRLIFSSWRVVPKTVAALLSYEVERRIIQRHDPDAAYSDGRTNRGYLLDIAESDDRLTGMPLFSLLYPSPTLADLGDPADFAHRFDDTDRPTQEQLRTRVADAIDQRLTPIIDDLASAHTDAPRGHDEAWYWAAPLLLDTHNPDVTVQDWVADENAAARWQADVDDTEADTEFENWQAHVDRFQAAAAGNLDLGPPPDDLTDLLTDVAIAAPATTTLRAITRRLDTSMDTDAALTGAAQVAWEFRSVFNHPETTSLIRGTYTDDPYWRRVLQYCRHGNLQAVLDEWTHMLDDFGLEDAAPATVIDTIIDDMRDALSLRTASAKMDDITVEDDDISLTERRIRCHFAMQFGRAEDFDADGRIRTDDVRDAFNSPFWPFVLATTSVGQEGLDFHPYCHAVLHWNLPSNPVDLEQREGRVHRYKGHAVRKNAATTHGHHALQNTTSDPWETLFSHAADAADTDSDLAPYWVYTGDIDAAAAGIERHAPMLPVSNEQHQYAELKESLAVYRMAFGQPRQEDLVEYLLQHLDRDELNDRLTTLQIDLSPP